MEILNRKAKFNYFVIDDIEAGLELKGTEIKSIRKGKASKEPDAWKDHKQRLAQSECLR
mgnify:CR=1 FL=1